MDKVKGLITDDDFVAMSKDFVKEKERLQKLVQDRQEKIIEIEEKIENGDNRRELVEQYIKLEHLTREMVVTLIDHINVGKRIPGTRDVPIEIHWNF